MGGVGAGGVELGGVDRRVIGAEALRHALRTDDPGTITDSQAAGFRAFADAMGADRLALAAQAEAARRDIQAPTRVLAARPEVLFLKR